MLRDLFILRRGLGAGKIPFLRRSTARVISAGTGASTGIWQVAHNRFADALPLAVKGWIKSRRPRVLSQNVIAYRLIPIDRIEALNLQFSLEAGEEEVRR